MPELSQSMPVIWAAVVGGAAALAFGLFAFTQMMRVGTASLGRKLRRAIGWGGLATVVSGGGAAVAAVYSEGKRKNHLADIVDHIAPLTMHTRPECPHSPDSLHLTIQPAVTDVPEFNDCQRFIVVDGDGNKSYTHMYAIYARYELQSGIPSLQPGQHKVAATIYSWAPNGETYSPLNLYPEFNCLYLEKVRDERLVKSNSNDPDPTGRAEWKAWVTRNGAEPHCPESSSDERHDLEVRLDPRRFHPKEVPPVARWDWDAINNQQYVGIACGNDWCEVGPDGFVPSDTLDLTGIADDIRYVHRAKGWYDQQYLAVKDAAGMPIPSNTFATVVPNPNVTEADYTGPDGAISAFVYVTGPTYSELNLFPTTGGQQNIVRVKLQDGTLPDNLTEFTGTFVAHGGNPPKTAKVFRRGHLMYAQAGFFMVRTARWRWTDADETVWVECSNGCCQACTGPNCL